MGKTLLKDFIASEVKRIQSCVPEATTALATSVVHALIEAPGSPTEDCYIEDCVYYRNVLSEIHREFTHKIDALEFISKHGRRFVESTLYCEGIKTIPFFRYDPNNTSKVFEFFLSERSFRDLKSLETLNNSFTKYTRDPTWYGNKDNNSKTERLKFRHLIAKVLNPEIASPKEYIAALHAELEESKYLNKFKTQLGYDLEVLTKGLSRAGYIEDAQSGLIPGALELVFMKYQSKHHLPLFDSIKKELGINSDSVTDIYPHLFGRNSNEQVAKLDAFERFDHRSYFYELEDSWKQFQVGIVAHFEVLLNFSFPLYENFHKSKRPIFIKFKDKKNLLLHENEAFEIKAGPLRLIEGLERAYKVQKLKAYSFLDVSALKAGVSSATALSYFKTIHKHPWKRAYGCYLVKKDPSNAPPTFALKYDI